MTGKIVTIAAALLIFRGTIGVKLFNAERMVVMQVLDKNQEILDSVDSAMNLLFSRLDEAIDDMKNGRVLTEEELWTVIEQI